MQQYAGTIGKIDNRQWGVSLSACSQPTWGSGTPQFNPVCLTCPTLMAVVHGCWSVSSEGSSVPDPDGRLLGVVRWGWACVLARVGTQLPRSTTSWRRRAGVDGSAAPHAQARRGDRAVSGAVDAVTAPVLAARVGKQLLRVPHVVLDMGEVSVLGPQGLTVLLMLYQEAMARGVELHIIGVERDEVRRPLHARGQVQFVTFDATVDAVIASLPLPARSRVDSQRD